VKHSTILFYDNEEFILKRFILIYRHMYTLNPHNLFNNKIFSTIRYHLKAKLKREIQIL